MGRNLPQYRPSFVPIRARSARFSDRSHRILLRPNLACSYFVDMGSIGIARACGNGRTLYFGYSRRGHVRCDCSFGWDTNFRTRIYVDQPLGRIHALVTKSHLEWWLEFSATPL